MSAKPLGRRGALRTVALLGAAAPFVACRKTGPVVCIDVTGLTEAEKRARFALAYVESTPKPGDRCIDCAQWLPDVENGCGRCRVMKGPVNPDGYCKLYTRRT